VSGDNRETTLAREKPRNNPTEVLAGQARAEPPQFVESEHASANFVASATPGAAANVASELATTTRSPPSRIIASA
jgi:hypothetical protein